MATEVAKTQVAARRAARGNGEGIVCDVLREVGAHDPCGGGSPSNCSSSDEVRALFAKRAWNLSISPAKNIGPSIFMIYMMGGGIFSLVFLGFSMMNAVKTLLAVNRVFDDFERAAKVKASTLLQRAAYSAICIAFIVYFLHRAVSTGILPFGATAVIGAARSKADLPFEPIPLVL